MNVGDYAALYWQTRTLIEQDDAAALAHDDRPLADVVDELSVPDTIPADLGGGRDRCPHDDLYVGLVDEGPTRTTVHYRCRACGEDIEKNYGHGYEGVE